MLGVLIFLFFGWVDFVFERDFSMYVALTYIPGGGLLTFLKTNKNSLTTIDNSQYT